MALAFLINGLTIAVVVVFHYEVLWRLARYLPNLPIRARFRILVGVFGAFTAHVIEVWIFAAVYAFKVSTGMFGTLAGQFEGTLFDFVYFSLVSYTTLGYGDIHPTGHLRFLAGLESLAGLVLITWSASFLFLEMARYWQENR